MTEGLCARPAPGPPLPRSRAPRPGVRGGGRSWGRGSGRGGGAGRRAPRRLAPQPVPDARLSLAPQYGFVNHALELLVIRNYGPEVWEDIK